MKFQKIVSIIFISLLSTLYIQSQCLEESHSVNRNDSWLSCQAAVIPKDSAPTKYHWIYYDLGYHYALGTVKIWNYNVANETGKGIKDGEIFYSIDGQNWVSGNSFQIPEANGQKGYSGWEGIDLAGSNARYLMIVAYSNWDNGDCTGLSEIRFNIVAQTTALQKTIVPASELLVFPNPVNQVLSIKLKNNQPIQELVLINSAGHEVFRKTKSSANFKIEVSSFPVGMYFLKLLTTNQEYITSKFVKTDL